MNIGVDVLYLDDGYNVTLPISMKSLTKLRNRKDPYRAAIARFMLDDFKRHYIRILDIREEYLQDISEEDAIAEGVEKTQHGFKIGDYCSQLAVDCFSTLWDSINKLPAKQWDANPRVTAYTYEFLWEIAAEAA